MPWEPKDSPATLSWSKKDGAGTTTWGSVIEVPVVQVQGENGPRLKVDQHGQARTILYGPNGQPLMTEENPMYVVIQGKDGSTPVPVKVDSQGRLVLADVNVSVGDVTVDVGVIKQGAKDSTAEPWEVQLSGAVDISDKAERKLGEVTLTGSKAELGSLQYEGDADTVEDFLSVEGATQIELYVETGYVRVRTNGETAAFDRGEPIGAGFGAVWSVTSISVYFVETSIITVVYR